MHIMVDLEALATEATAVITQIAAVEFEPVPGGKIYIDRGFNAHPNIDTQRERLIDGDTLCWWMEQGGMAKKFFINGQREWGIPLYKALSQLNEFVRQHLTDLDCIWSLRCLRHRRH